MACTAIRTEPAGMTLTDVMALVLGCAVALRLPDLDLFTTLMCGMGLLPLPMWIANAFILVGSFLMIRWFGPTWSRWLGLDHEVAPMTLSPDENSRKPNGFLGNRVSSRVS